MHTRGQLGSCKQIWTFGNPWSEAQLAPSLIHLVVKSFRIQSGQKAAMSNCSELPRPYQRCVMFTGGSACVNITRLKVLFVSTCYMLDACSIYHLENHCGDTLCVQNVCRKCLSTREMWFSVSSVESEKTGVSGTVCAWLLCSYLWVWTCWRGHIDAVVHCVNRLMMNDIWTPVRRVTTRHRAIKYKVILRR